MARVLFLAGLGLGPVCAFADPPVNLPARLPAEAPPPAGEAERVSIDPSAVESLVGLADAFGPRLAGAVWIPDGPALGERLANIPFARFLEKVRMTSPVAATSRWLSGLPLPPEGWGVVLQGPALLVWVRPVEYGTFENSQTSTLPEEAARDVELALIVHLDPDDPAAGKPILRWLASKGYLAARERHPDLHARRRRVAGNLLHLWERSRPNRDSEPILAYGAKGNLLVLAGDERILGEALAGKTGDSSGGTGAPRAALTASVLRSISDAQTLNAPLAGVFDVRAFPILESAQWFADGLGLSRVGALADRLAAHDARTSAAVDLAERGIADLSRRARTGGVSDLSRIEILFWPDDTLPRSRIRLVFDEGARIWMEKLATARPFNIPDLAPEECVAFWSMRVPRPLAEPEAEPDGTEIGRVFIPTRLRVSSAWVIEAPRLAAYLRAQMTRIDTFLTTTTLELPTGEVSLSSPWARVKQALRAFEPFMPLIGVPYKVRVLRDSLALSTSHFALDKLAEVDRGGAKSLRDSRPELFDSETMTVQASDLGPGRTAFERYNDLAFRAESTRALDIVTFPFLEEPGEDAKWFQINYFALAQKIPQVREWLATLPPHHSRVVWYPGAATMEVDTQSASGLPGDLRVWAATGAALVPTFDLDSVNWGGFLDDLKDIDWQRWKELGLEKFDPRRWLSGENPEKTPANE